MSDATCKIKNRTNEEMAARREYGIPRRKGESYYIGSEDTTEYNTLRSDFCCTIRMPEETQKFYFDRDVQNCRRDERYIEFLQDYFYRKWKGYRLPYFEYPIGNPKRIELYNQTALESGHPEYMIDSEGNPLKISAFKKPVNNGKNIEDKQHQESKVENAGQVDVLDADGNVVAENVSSVKDNKEKKSKKDKAPDVIYVEPAKEEKPKEEKKPEPKDAEKPKKSGLEEAAFFHEVGPAGDCWVDEERGKEFSKNNASFVKKYPGLQKLVDLCKSNGYIVKFYDIHGLVRADIYMKGSLRFFRILNIDPAKVRNQYSVLAGGMEEGQLKHPFDAIFASFDEPYFADIVLGAPTKEMLDDTAAKSGVNYSFFKYINYNAFPNDEIALAAANTYALCAKMQELGMNIRFKVTKHESADDFTMKVMKNPGLGYYVDNDPWNGLDIHMIAGNGKVAARVTGDHADEFIKLIGEDIVCSDKISEEEIKKALSITEEKSEPKQSQKPKTNSGKKNRTIEKPMGRG